MIQELGCQEGKCFKSEVVICSEGKNEIKVELPRRVNLSTSEG